MGTGSVADPRLPSSPGERGRFLPMAMLMAVVSGGLASRCAVPFVVVEVSGPLGTHPAPCLCLPFHNQGSSRCGTTPGT